ncbi:MAG TPA: mannose-6-phosphate isomerase, class I, partial [Desulfosarcina sp.]|nr:mannose-6-phosphate isomerase, class I [Desulfosarcina sp.]
MPIYRLENTIQNYAWGSSTAIAELLGQPSPSRHPQAELWMGTHPKGPSRVVVDGERMPLQRLIEQDPLAVLGPHAADRFDNALPYLFKVLAAARPLSIQAHPSKDQAQKGFSKENQDHIPLDAPDRNYRDDNHKPEIICALTPFWGVNGFRSAATAVRLLEPVCPEPLKKALNTLMHDGEPGLQAFFESMMTLPDAARESAARQIREKAGRLAHSSPVYR